MIARLKLIATEAVRSLGANLSTTFAAVMTVLIGMFMLGLVVGLGSWALSLSDHYKKQLVVKVYFCTRLMCGTDATRDQEAQVHNKLIAIKQVKTLNFISREKAYEIMKKQRPDLLKVAPGNPFPDSYDVFPNNGEEIDAITRQLNPLPAGVQQICPPAPGTKAAESAIGQSCNRITHRVLSVARYLWIVVLIAFVVLLVSSTLLVANTIRLSIFARRREIEVMKLVGATNWFVRGPFMIEGLLAGLGGAVAAIILLLLGRTLFLGHVIHLRENDVHAWPFGLHVLIVLGAGLLLGAAGSGLTIRRFLQV
ncbi:MAG TPA: permease-like cell division protein FtsX [Gaiellaceae bacterium]|jgi:cell division transport system permease protein